MVHLQPDIIILSVGAKRLNKINFTFLQPWRNLITPVVKDKVTYYVIYSIVKLGGKSVVVVNSPPQQTPFGGFTGIELLEIGTRLAQLYKSLT